MLKLIHIAGIGEGLFWLVIVIVWIIIQLVRSSKKASKSSEEQQTTEPYVAPAEGLQKFLQSLTGEPQPPTPPAAPRPQPPAPVRKARPAAAPAAQVARKTPPLPPSVRTVRPAPPPLAKAPPRRTPGTAYQKPAPRIHEGAYELEPELSKAVQRASVAIDLGERRSLRKAIVLREILGPPLALR